MNSSLADILPKYIEVLNEVVPSMKRWNKSMFRALDNLLKVASHGSSNKRILEAYQQFIDNMLNIANSPILNNDLPYESSSSEADLIDSAETSFSNKMNEPTSSRDAKKKRLRSSLLRSMKAQGKQSKSDSQSSRKEDIKTMQNSDVSLSTTLTSLKYSAEENSNELDLDKTQKLLENIKGKFEAKPTVAINNFNINV